MTRPAGTLLTAALLALGAPAGTALAWTCVLPDSAVVPGPLVRLGEIAAPGLPPPAADLLVLSGGAPGGRAVLSRQAVLRHLVGAGLAADVDFAGAPRCSIRYAGASLPTGRLDEAMRELVQAIVPPAEPGGPAPWFELEPPADAPPVAGPWNLQLARRGPLEPGRNQVRFLLKDERGDTQLNAAVVLHACGEAARIQREVSREEALLPDMFRWEWADLAEGRQGRVFGRESLAGACAARPLEPGRFLQEQDIKSVPLVRSGDAVDLSIVRGRVAVSVQAVARRAGGLGQTIPVRNEMTGKIVNARIIGPGSVEWRR